MMKKKTTISLLAAGMLGMILISTASAATIIPVWTGDSALVTITPGNPRGLFAYYNATNVFGTMYASGTMSGRFQQVNWLGTNVGAALTRQATEDYPLSFGKQGATVGNWEADPWNVRWYNTANITNPLESSASYNITFDVYDLGNLANGQESEFALDLGTNLRYYKVDLAIPGAGVYILWYSGEVTLGANNIISPSGQALEIRKLSLPPMVTGSPLKKLILFVASETGSHRFYFSSDLSVITLKLENQATTKTLNMEGDRVDYSDDASCITIGCAKFKINVYEVDVKDYQPLYYNYLLKAGAPNVYIAAPGYTGYSLINVASGGANKIFAPPAWPSMGNFEQNAYIIVVHDQYFGMGLIQDIMTYRLIIGKIPVVMQNFTDTAKHTIDSSIGFKVVRLTSNTDKGAMINATATNGAPVIDLTNLWRQDDMYGYRANTRLQNVAPHSLFGSLNGTYDLILAASNTIDTPERLQLECHVVGGLLLPVTNIDYTDPYLDTSSGFTQVGQPFMFNGNTWLGHNELIPTVNRFNFDDMIYGGVNISMWRADNPGIFNEVLNDLQIWVWSGTENTYVNIANSPSAMALFVNGTANTHPVYIGSPHKFDRLVFDLATGSTSNNYTWAYRQADITWNPFPSTTWVDTTSNVASTLQQDGMITFNPADVPNWNRDTDVNPSNGAFTINSTMPLWWVRLNCSIEAPASIPSIAAGITTFAYRYAELSMTVRTNVAIPSFMDGYSPSIAAVDANSPFTINGNNSVYSVLRNFGVPLMGQGTGLLSTWVTTVTILNYSASQAGVAVPLNKTVNLRLGIQDRKGYYYQGSITGLLHPSTYDTLHVNWSTYTDYRNLASYNGTEYTGAIFQISGDNMYDWYQFICSSNNTPNPTYQFLFADPWSRASMKGFMTAFGGAGQNQSFERGIAIRNFWLIVDTGVVDDDFAVKLKLAVSKFDVPVIQIDSSLVPVEANPSTSLIPGLPDWLLWTMIGGGGVAAVVCISVALKKKNRWKV